MMPQLFMLVVALVFVAVVIAIEVGSYRRQREEWADHNQRAKKHNAYVDTLTMPHAVEKLDLYDSKGIVVAPASSDAPETGGGDAHQ